MANEQYLEEFVSPAGFKNLVDLQKSIEANNKALQEGIIIAKKYTDSITGAGGTGAFNRNAANIAKAQEDIAKKVAQRQAAEARLERQQQINAVAEQKRQAKAQSDEAKKQSEFERLAAKRRRIVQESTAQDIANSTRQAEANSIVTTTVNAENEALARQASQATAVVASNEALAASSTQAAVAQTELAVASNFVGSNLGSSVVSGAKKAFSSLRTIANILPGIGIAGLLGFLTSPIIDYISSLDLFKKKLNELLAIRKEVSDANLKGAQNAQLEIVQLETLYRVAQNVNATSEQRYRAAKKLQDQYPDTFKNFSIEQIELGKVGKFYDLLKESILATARARASQDKIAENSSRQLENEQKVNDALLDIDKQRNIQQKSLAGLRDASQGGSARFNADAAARAEQRIADNSKIIRDAKKDSLILDGRNLALLKNINVQVEKGAQLADPAKGNKGTKVKEAPENFGTTLQDIVAQSEAIFKNDQNSYEKRLGALDSFIENKKILADGDAFAIKTIEINGAKERQKIVDEANKFALKSFTDQEQKEIEELRSTNNAKLEAIEDLRSKETLALSKQYAEGKINKKQYENSLLEIETNASKDRLAAQIETVEKIISKERELVNAGIGNSQQLAKDERDLSNLKIQLSKLTVDEQIKGLAKYEDALKTLHDKEKELLFALLDLAKTIGDGIFDSRKNAIQEEINLNEKKKAQDIENINDSVLTEQEKADKILIINARADAQQDLLKQKQKEIDIKKAQFDKAASIARIIAATAVAEVEALTYLSNPFTAPLYPAIATIIGALSAIQIAAILATPIPKYAKGTESSPEGLAYVGEKGTEGRINPDGSFELTPDSATLTYLEKGTKIIPNHDLVRMIAKPDSAKFTGAQQVPWNEIIMSNDRLGKKLSKAFSDQTVNSTKITRGGWQNTQGKMSKLQSHIKRNFN